MAATNLHEHIARIRKFFDDRLGMIVATATPEESDKWFDWQITWPDFKKLGISNPEKWLRIMVTSSDASKAFADALFQMCEGNLEKIIVQKLSSILVVKCRKRTVSYELTDSVAGYGRYARNYSVDGVDGMAFLGALWFAMADTRGSTLTTSSGGSSSSSSLAESLSSSSSSPSEEKEEKEKEKLKTTEIAQKRVRKIIADTSMLEVMYLMNYSVNGQRFNGLFQIKLPLASGGVKAVFDSVVEEVCSGKASEEAMKKAKETILPGATDLSVRPNGIRLYRHFDNCMLLLRTIPSEDGDGDVEEFVFVMHDSFPDCSLWSAAEWHIDNWKTFLKRI